MEKRLEVKVKKIIGQPNPKEGQWSDALTFEPGEGTLEKRRGRIFAVLDLTGSTRWDLAGFGRQTLEELRRAYYDSQETSPLAALETAVHRAQHQLVELAFGPGGAVPDGTLDYNFAAAVLWGSVLYVAKLGTAGIYLRRGEVTRELGEAADSKVFSASGMVGDKDAVVLGSSDFRRTFAVGELPAVMADLEKLITDLGQPAGLSALILRLELATVPGEEERVVIAPVASKKSLGGKIRAFWPRRRKRPEIFRKISRTLLLLPALLFLLATGWTMRQRQTDFRAAETERLVQEAEQTLTDARQYVDLNNSRARDLLLTAKSDFEAAGALGGAVLGWSEKVAEIDKLLDEVDKVKRVKPEVVEGAAVSFDPLAGLKSPPTVGASVVDVGTYFDNIYFLVPSENQIRKSVPTEEGYSEPGYWVTEENPSLADAVAMAIDGFIYVLKADGRVLKFEKGELVSDFSLKELDQPLKNPRAIFTTIDSEHLYLLDAGSRRIVITDKNGLYQSQYIYGEVPAGPTDLVVDEAAGVIYLSDGTNIFRIEM